MKGRGGVGNSSGGGSSSRTKKIVICPYKLPPQLPVNYYETTVKELIQVTLAVLDQKRSTESSTSSSSSSYVLSSTTTSSPSDALGSSSSSSSKLLSLQNAYMAVVNLVSHQYGPRLYQDLRKSMQEACERVLPDHVTTLWIKSNDSHNNSTTTTNTTTTTLNDSDANHLLQIIPVLYQSYTEYLLCVKHIFLSLDRTHVWQSDIQQVLPIRGTTTVSSSSSSHNNNNNNNFPLVQPTAATTTIPTTVGVVESHNIPQQGNFSPHAQQSLWQVGLAVWADRLKKLGIDTILYQAWLQSLLDQWNPGKKSLDHSGMIFSTSTTTTHHHPSSSSSDPNLRSVWYMWQDLGWLSILPLQRDLEHYWKTESRSWESEIPYRPSLFLDFCYHKHLWIQKWTAWLPSAWLMGIVEQCFFQPHLIADENHNINNNNISEYNNSFNKKNLPVPGLLLQPVNFNPLMEEAIFTQGGGGRFKSSGEGAISQLWALAGRLPNGQAMVARAIAQFARTLGLQRVGSAVEKKKTPTLTTTNPNNNNNNNNGAVGELLALQRALASLIRSLPLGTDLINLKTVWEEVVNQDTTPSVAESLAKFLDQILRSNKKMDQYQQESENWLDIIISGVFVPLQAKDVFEAFYKRDLAKRLLWNRVVSMDIEKQVCSLLKAECGAAYTSKMEGMFQDVDWSRETMMVYKQSSAGLASTHASVEMEVQVLTTGYWPVYPQYPNLQVPVALQEQQEQFTNHYKTKYQGRRMTWQYALGHCIVKCSGFGRQYELIVSLCQAVVLLQFQTGSEWTLKDLLVATGLEDKEEMERILQSLSLGKEGTRILRKLDFDAAAPPDKKKKVRMNVDEKDKFVICENFESNQRRIRIQNILMKETLAEREKTVEGVCRDRLYLIDAVLVRILKARKTILHQMLIPQVLEQVKVPAQPADVKKRIESLIEREYMERDPKDRNRYNYLA